MSPSIRTLRADDGPTIAAAFAAIGWQASKPIDQYGRYFSEQQAGQREVLVAEWRGNFAGYLTVQWRSEYVDFARLGIPEITDLNVLPRFRRRGLASRLLDRAEALIATRSNRAGIAVGLHPGYNAAQRLYVLRGYVPDGRGVMWRGRFIEERQQVVADDDLTLHLVKALPSLV